MGQVFALYGAKFSSLKEAAEIMAAALGLEFSLHESSYRGGEYFRAHSKGFDKMTVEANWEDSEGYLAEPDYADHSILVYISNPCESVKDALEAIECIRLLRIEDLE
ncbi:hypothetical protein ACH4U6_22390 [Streptomyces netropsis]|uniref:hypothetical protein n=1 Tax=Streptomyces netropsis TaxID=55404 RepID=UPI0037B9CD66